MRALLILGLIFNVAFAICGEANIETEIQALDSEDFDAREGAQFALLKRGAKVVAPLKQALKAKKSEEFGKRAAKVIDFFEGGGEIENGLKIKLSADGSKIVPGKPITLTATLYNTTVSELNVRVGWKWREQNYHHLVESDLRRVIPVMQEDGSVLECEQTMDHFPIQYRGFEMTPSVYMTLKPLSTASFTTEFAVTLDPARRPAKHEKRLWLTSGRAQLAVAAGKFRLRAVFLVDKPARNEIGITFTAQGGGAGNQEAELWAGEVRSNDLVLESEL